MTDYGTIFDEKPDTSAIDTIRKLEARIAELESQLAQANEMFSQLEMNNVDVRMYATKLEQALMDMKHLTDPIIERARRALEHKP